MMRHVYVAHPLPGNMTRTWEDRDIKAFHTLKQYFGAECVHLLEPKPDQATVSIAPALAGVIGLYLRYSSTKQDDGVSVDTQIRSVKTHLDAMYPGSPLFVSMDLAKSGQLIEGREGFYVMSNMARAKRLTRILVYKYDRLGRNYNEQISALSQIEVKFAVPVESATESPDPMARKFALMLADLSNSQHSSRLVDALATTAVNGFATGGACFGYKIVPVNPDSTKSRKVYKVVPEQAEVVREIYRLYISGLGYKKIAATLNERGIRSSVGGAWDTSTVLYLLRNWRKYAGFQTLRKVTRRILPGGEKMARRNPEDQWIVSGKRLHPAVLSQDLIDAYIKERDRRKSGRTYNMKGGRGGLKNPETGILKCGTCGGNCNAHVSSRKGYVYRKWECGYSRRRGETVCTNRARVSVEGLRETLINTIEKELFSADNVNLVVKLAKALVQSVRKGCGKAVASTDRRIAKTQREIENGTRAILRGCSGKEFDHLKQKVKSLGEELQMLQAHRDSILSVQKQNVNQGMEERLQAGIGRTCQLIAQGTAQLVHEELRRHIETMRLHPDGRVEVKATLSGLLKGNDLHLPFAAPVAQTVGEGGGD